MKNRTLLIILMTDPCIVTRLNRKLSSRGCFKYATPEMSTKIEHGLVIAEKYTYPMNRNFLPVSKKEKVLTVDA